MQAEEPLQKPGLIVPPMTPFTEDGEVHFEAFDAQLELILEECRVTAIPLMAVEVQEYRYLSLDEREEAIRTCAEIIDGRIPIVVGISHPSTRHTIEFSEVATEVDADAVQVLIPDRATGGWMEFEEIERYFEEIAEAIDLPIIAYHNPSVGASLTADELESLATLDRVVAFKESSRNLRHVLTLIERVDRGGLAAYFTTMEMALATLSLGGSGVTTPPPPAILLTRLIDAYEAGDLDQSIAVQRTFAEFPAGWLGYGFPAVMKATLAYMGIDAGVPHPPTPPISGPDREALTSLLDTLDLPSSARRPD